MEPAYLAGIIDGDGTITVEVTFSKKNKRLSFIPYIKIALSATDAWLLERITQHFGGHIWRKKRFAEWGTTNKKVIKEILNKILPYLQLKKRRAELVLKCIEILERVDYRVPRTLLREDIEELVNIIEEIRKESAVHSQRVKWTKEKIMEIVNSDKRYSREWFEERRRYLMDIGKRGRHFQKGHMPWNKLPREVELEIVNEYRSGTPIKEICSKFKIAESTLYKVLRRNCVERGRPRRPPPPRRTPTEIEDKVIELYRGGTSVKEICIYTGLSWSTIYKILKRRGVALGRATVAHTK